MIRDRADLSRVQVAVALRERLRMRQRALHRPRPSKQAVAHRLHMLSDDAQARQLPQEVRHLLHDARTAVLHGQHGSLDRTHRERVERQAESRKADSLGVRKERRDGLVRVRPRLALVGNLHPKIRCRSVSATWL